MKNQPQFLLYRNKCKKFIQTIMNRINSEPRDDYKDLSSCSELSMQQLQSMQIVTKMKEAADKVGTSIVCGFITENGEHFIVSNVENPANEVKTFKERLFKSNGGFSGLKI